MNRLVLIIALILLSLTCGGCKACGSILDWLGGPADDPKNWTTDPSGWNSGPAH